MKNIEIDDDLYLHIVANTQFIGENASSILRRLLKLNETAQQAVLSEESVDSDVLEEPLSESSANTEADASESSEIEAFDNSSESVFNFINKEELAMQRGAVGRFLLILAALYRAHPNRFRVVTEICGRDRLYFANSEAELAASGSSTKPKQIPDSPFWVLTNSNTTRKKMMLTKAATSLGYNDDDVEKIRELL
ncbi:replication initiation negative regulator SeqA [Colwellia sp. 4_MG-2023]|uniref:replication initiation negative regulator SeqA n=1 Tax=unclassified Colwellia TaxID=196834 RepID=UPI0026E1A11D|nr:MULTISPECIES: replication initiation negative regulator SeqA [unclassified Colwellia]MDO6505647.1 replication initiation negative regulator SeqA [Colwellia sp. 5_MG-2023]MDO6554057.1 replication initiation negative regulator SeqA [Colwellia sp. 4_MG-2023]